MLENAVGGHLHQEEGLSQRWMPREVRRRLYITGLLRGQLDEALDRFVARPFVHLFRWCDRAERAWTDFLSGTGSRESDWLVPAAPTREEV
jgi:NAD(P)H-quinone oxidoreductase subunit 5